MGDGGKTKDTGQLSVFPNRSPQTNLHFLQILCAVSYCLPFGAARAILALRDRGGGGSGDRCGHGFARGGGEGGGGVKGG